MSIQQSVPAEQIHSTIEESALRGTPVALTCMVQQSWRSYRSRFLGVRDGELWVEYPACEVGDAHGRPEMAVGQRLGLAFKQRHYKYAMTTTVLGMAELSLSSTVTVDGLRIDWPNQLQRLQRRAFFRAIVPSDRPCFAEFWQGGTVKEPHGPTRAKLVYGGQVLDISAGGVRVRLVGERDPSFHTGDPMGIRLTLHGLSKPLLLDGQFRHAASDEFGATLGLQFTGLDQGAHGEHDFHQVTRLVGELQRLQVRRTRAGIADCF